MKLHRFWIAGQSIRNGSEWMLVRGWTQNDKMVITIISLTEL